MASGTTSAASSAVSSASSVASSAVPTQITHHHSLSGGAIAGIVIGIVIGGGLLLLLGMCLCCRSIFKRSNKKAERHEEPKPQVQQIDRSHNPRASTSQMERGEQPVCSAQYAQHTSTTGMTPAGGSRNTVPAGLNASDVAGHPSSMGRNTGGAAITGRQGAGESGGMSGMYNSTQQFVNTHGGAGGNLACDTYGQAQKYEVRNP